MPKTMIAGLVSESSPSPVRFRVRHFCGAAALFQRRADGCGVLRLVLTLLAVSVMVLTSTVVDGLAPAHLSAYEYTTDEVNAAAAADLERALDRYVAAGNLNRSTPQFERAYRLFARLIDVARQRSDFGRKLEWKFLLHEGRLAEAYSRAGGKIVISAAFVHRYRLDDAELAFVIGHEIAHVLCEHERMNLSAVWRRNAPHRLQARYAMEYLDTEPFLRAQLAPVIRLQESVADRVGLELVAAAGIDGVSALGFFDKSAADGEAGVFADVHDLPAARKAALLQTEASSRPWRAPFRSRTVSCAA